MAKVAVKKLAKEEESWATQHTRLLNFLDNDVGWFSAAATIAGLVFGVSDILAAAKVVEDVEETTDAIRDVKVGTDIFKETKIAKLGIEATTDAKESSTVVSKSSQIAAKLNAVADYSGIASGVAQSIQGSTYGVKNGAILNVTAGIANTFLSFMDIRASSLGKEADKAEKAVEEATTESEKVEKLNKYSIAKKIYESTQEFSDKANLVVGTVASVGVGAYDMSTGSKGTGGTTIAYGISYGIASYPNEIMVAAHTFF